MSPPASLPIDDRVGLPSETRTAIERELSVHRTLQDVARWALGRAAAGETAIDVIVQDEFTHDVVVPWGSGLFLVYDAT